MNIEVNKKVFWFFVYLMIISTIAILIVALNNIIQKNFITLNILLITYLLFIVCGFVYWFFKGCEDEIYVNQRLSQGNRKILTIIIITFFTILLYIISNNIYIKSIEYYIVTTIIAFLISFLILFSDLQKSSYDSYKLLIIIIIFASLIRASSYIINPQLVGIDSHYHFTNIQYVVETGEIIRSFDHYYHYPTYYLLYSITGVISTFNKNIYYFINIGTSIITIVITYSITQKVFNNLKVSLIASLLTSISTIQLFCIVFNQGKIAGVTLVLLTFLLLIREIQEKTSKNRALIWLVLITVFFWHPEVSFPIIFLLCGYLVSQYLAIFEGLKNRFKRSVHITFNSSIVAYILLFFFHLFFLHTTLGSYLVRTFFGDEQRATMIMSVPFTGAVSISFLFQYFFGYIGLTLLFFFFTHQFLCWLKNLDQIKSFSISSVCFLHFVPLFGVMSGKFTLGAERSLIIIISIITILSAKKFILFFSESFANNERYEFIKRMGGLIFFIAFFFLSTTSYFIGDGNTIMNNEIPRINLITTNMFESFHSHTNHYVDNANYKLIQTEPDINEFLSDKLINNKKMSDGAIRKDGLIYSNGQYNILINQKNSSITFPKTFLYTPFFPSKLSIRSASTYHDKWNSY